MQQTPEAPTAVDVFGDRIPRNVDQALSPGYLAARDALASVERPINNGQPVQALSKHTPFDRLVCYMSMRGMSNRAIAEQFDKSETTIATILKQPASQTFITEELRAMAAPGIENLLKEQVAPTILKLIQIRDDSGVSAATRHAACNSILDRALGKAVQHIKSDSTVTYDDAQRSKEEIDRELAALRAQVKETPPSAN